jgi:Cu2+-exporting ATPase
MIAATAHLASPTSTPAGARSADASSGDAGVPVDLDDPEVQAAFTTWEHGVDGTRLARSHLRLAGLWCAGCAGTVERALTAEPGVREARATYATERASVVWDPERTNIARLLAAVRRAGYDAAPDAAASARALRDGARRATLWRLFVAAFCLMQVMMYQAPLYVAAPGTLVEDLRALLLWAAWLLSVPVVVFSATPIFRDAWRGVRRRRIGMDVPVALGIALTFVVSSGATFSPGGVFGSEAYFDSLTMFVTFLLAGRYLALRLRDRVASSLEGALTRLPVVVRRLNDDGTTSTIALGRLRRGDRVRVLVGEAFPADGRVLEGASEADESLLTGESRPVTKRPGDEAIAGSVNLGGIVVQRVERIGAETRHDGIVALLRAAISERPPLVRAADRVAAWFLWTVLVLAASAALVWSWIDPTRAVWVAVSVLVVTCPCALSLAAPSALLAAAGALARRGVLVRRLEAIEALALIDTACFDKTGTLTLPGAEQVEVELRPAAVEAGLDERAVLAIASALASASSHPLAVALAAQAGAGASPVALTNFSEQPGAGVRAEGVDGRVYRLGARAWSAGDDADAAPGAALETWLGNGRAALARLRLTERQRAGAAESVATLRAAGLRVELLSGDASPRVEAIGARRGVDRARGDASAADTIAAVAALQAEGRRVAMVGDGLNDAPVMARADVSFAIGEGPALTRTHADFVLLSGSLAEVAAARAIARRTMRIVRQNLAWAAAYNALCVPLALAGMLAPWAAGLGMASSSLFVVLNALRVDRRPRQDSGRVATFGAFAT